MERDARDLVSGEQLCLTTQCRQHNSLIKFKDPEILKMLNKSENLKMRCFSL